MIISIKIDRMDHQFHYNEDKKIFVRYQRLIKLKEFEPVTRHKIDTDITFFKNDGLLNCKGGEDV